MAGAGILDGARNRRKRSLVKDDVHTLAGARGGVGVAEIAFEEMEAPAKVGEVLAFAGFKVVEAANVCAALDERAGNPRSNESGATRNKYLLHPMPMVMDGFAAPGMHRA